MELKENMYVRIKDNRDVEYIGKLININEFREPSMKYGMEANYLKDIIFIGDDYILKASHNIIDLIEVGDYVNGDLVLFAGATTWDNDGNALVKQVHINHNGFDWWLREEYIKSIVTREQFESMAYKIGD